MFHWEEPGWEYEPVLNHEDLATKEAGVIPRPLRPPSLLQNHHFDTVIRKSMTAEDGGSCSMVQWNTPFFLSLSNIPNRGNWLTK